MDGLLTFTVTSFISIFFIVNPLGNAPVFLAITENDTPEARVQMVKRACFTMTGILILFAVMGQPLLDVFHLSLSAIRISGGIILFFLAYNMIQAERVKMRSRREEESEAKEKPDISIVPLAIPMLAGPGSITTILVLTSQNKSWVHLLIVIAAIAAAGIASYVVLTRAALLYRVLGKTGINIFTRLMGLLLSGLAVQFVLNGIAGALPDIVSRLKLH